MISNRCKLVLQDLYFYDFKSAYPRLLSSLGWNFEDVDLDNKAERNIFIGLSQRDNQNLSSYLMESVGQLLDFYLQENGVKEDEIIVTQRDGFILTRALHITDVMMKLDFRGLINLIIMSPDRKKYLTISDSGVDVKGMRNYYPALNTIYSQFGRLNFYNKTALFKQLERIKKEAQDNQDKKFYMAEVDGKHIVQTKNGVIEVGDERFFKLESVDKIKYFDHYFKEFFQSIMLEFF